MNNLLISLCEKKFVSFDAIAQVENINLCCEVMLCTRQKTAMEFKDDFVKLMQVRRGFVVDQQTVAATTRV